MKLEQKGERVERGGKRIPGGETSTCKGSDAPSCNTSADRLAVRVRGWAVVLGAVGDRMGQERQNRVDFPECPRGCVSASNDVMQGAV